MDPRLQAPAQAMRLAIGLRATLAGIDKFFTILVDWGSYVSPLRLDVYVARLGYDR